MSRIFMGAGDSTGAQCQRLHMLLDEAFSYISGSQQPCHCDRPDCECSDEIVESEQIVNDIAFEIVKSLLDDPDDLMDRGEKSTVMPIEEVFETPEEGARQYMAHRVLDEMNCHKDKIK